MNLLWILFIVFIIWFILWVGNIFIMSTQFRNEDNGVDFFNKKIKIFWINYCKVVFFTITTYCMYLIIINNI